MIYQDPWEIILHRQNILVLCMFVGEHTWMPMLMSETVSPAEILCSQTQKICTTSTVHLNTFLHLLNLFSAIHKDLLTGEEGRHALTPPEITQ